MISNKTALVAALASTAVAVGSPSAASAGQTQTQKQQQQHHTAQEVIAKLGLIPNVEKGYYIESFADAAKVVSAAAANGSAPARAASTVIYYLLEGADGESRWHRVLDAPEVWHYYAGAPLVLSLSLDDGAAPTRRVLGPDVFAEGQLEQRPQVVIRTGEWQRARSLGEWTLVGTTGELSHLCEGKRSLRNADVQMPF